MFVEDTKDISKPINNTHVFDMNISEKPLQVLCRLLEAKCVTWSYIDKFTAFHNRMSVIHNIFVKFLQTIYFNEAESARKIDAQLKFQYTGCLIWYLG